MFYFAGISHRPKLCFSQPTQPSSWVAGGVYCSSLSCLWFHVLPKLSLINFNVFLVVLVLYESVSPCIACSSTGLFQPYEICQCALIKVPNLNTRLQSRFISFSRLIITFISFILPWCFNQCFIMPSILCIPKLILALIGPQLITYVPSNSLQF